MKMKAVGYVSVKEKNVNSNEHQMVMQGFQLLCDKKGWELVKIYRDRKKTSKDPTPEMAKMLQEVGMNKNSDIEILISYAFGHYIVHKKPISA
ncbi:hypothetical protein [Oceanobacillus sp. CAU 1775]